MQKLVNSLNAAFSRIANIDIIEKPPLKLGMRRNFARNHFSLAKH